MKERLFVFSRLDHGIQLTFNGANLIFVEQTQLAFDTLSKLSEGLNHFLEYLYRTSIDNYNEVGSYLLSKLMEIKQESMSVLNNDETYMETRDMLIRKHFKPHFKIFQFACEYVSNTSVANADESKVGIEDVAMRNIDCDILHALSVIMKISYIMIADLRGSVKFENYVELFMDEILRDIIKASKDYFDYSVYEYDEDDLHDYIDTVMTSVYRREWIKNTPKFQTKFEEIGLDVNKFSIKNKVKIFTSLRKYVPALRDMNDPNYIIEGVEPSKVYWTRDKNFEDFALINKNMTSYIRGTSRSICRDQDSRLPIPNVNMPDFIQDGSDDVVIRKEVSLYHDEEKHLYEIKKNETVILFKEVINKLISIDDNNDLPVKDILKLKDHPLNNYILHRIVYALTGDSRIVCDQLGSLKFMVIFMFYEIIKTNDSVPQFLKNMIPAMMFDVVGQDPILDYDLDVILKENGINIPVDVFRSIMPIYSDGVHSFLLKHEDVIEFYKFMDEPHNVRSIIFPEKYPTSVDSGIGEYNTEREYRLFNKLMGRIGD